MAAPTPKRGAEAIVAAIRLGDARSTWERLTPEFRRILVERWATTVPLEFRSRAARAVEAYVAGDEDADGFEEFVELTRVHLEANLPKPTAAWRWHTEPAPEPDVELVLLAHPSARQTRGPVVVPAVKFYMCQLDGDWLVAGFNAPPS